MGQNAPQPTPAAPPTPNFLQGRTPDAPPSTMPGDQNFAQAGTTKAAKLATILSAGLQGALAGRAKSEETVAATGGRRSGGAGMGFEAGYELPWQREQKQLGLQQQQAGVAATQAQSQMINTPSGPMPAWLAKAILPASIKAGSAETVQGMKGDTAESIQGQKGATQEKIHRFIPTAVGLFDTQTRQTIPETQNGITITPEIAKDNDLPQEYIGKPMKLGELAQVRRADVFQNTPTMTAQGEIVVNRKDATARTVTGPGGQTYSPPALASPREVGDENNPGQTIITSGAGAMGKPGVNSASVQVPKKAAASEVPTNIGNKTVAFTTMIQHAQLLRNAAKLLNNGDVQSLSKLENAFKNEFGYSGPITARAIADAYNGEVTDVIGKGHITDKELEKTGKTLDVTAQNFETTDSVLKGYEALAQSKMDNLLKQKNAAVNKSQPNKTGGFAAWKASQNAQRP